MDIGNKMVSNENIDADMELINYLFGGGKWDRGGAINIGVTNIFKDVLGEMAADEGMSVTNFIKILLLESISARRGGQDWRFIISNKEIKCVALENKSESPLKTPTEFQPQQVDGSQYLKQLGNKIKAARKARKISLTKLSQMCGIDYSNLWELELGQTNTRILTLQSIANALKINVSELL